MKQLLLLATCFALSLAACRKSGSQPETIPPGVTATINGQPVTFNARYNAYNTSNTGTYNLSIIGVTGTVAPFNQLAIVVMGPRPAATGTYQHRSSNPGNYALLVYTYNGQSYIEDFTSTAPRHPVTVTVTSLTASNVQGTFSGQLVLPGETATGLQTITNGKFNVNF